MKRSCNDTEEIPSQKFAKDDREDLLQHTSMQSASNDPEEITSLQEEPLDSTSEIIFKLSSLLPRKIEARVLASQHDLCKQLKVTVEKRLEQWSFEETRFQELNLELPSSYGNKLQNDANLLDQIFAPLFGKVKKSTKLTFPNMRIDILNQVISKLGSLGEYQIIEVPFSVEDSSTIAEHCLEFIRLVHKSSQEIFFQPSPQYSENYKDLKSEIVKYFGKDSTEPLIKYGKQKIFPIKKRRDSAVALNDTKKENTKKSTTKGNPPSRRDSHQKKRKSITPSPLINPSYTFDQRLHGPHSGGLSSLTFTAYNFWQIDQIHAQNITGENVTVAVVDSGIDSSHPAFTSKIINSEDYTNTSNTNDEIGHGTMCAGIICGNSFKYSKNPNEYNEGESLETFPPGIAPNANLLVYKVFADSMNGSSDTVYKALEHIATRSDINIDIVCLSLGSLLFSLPIAKAITSLISKGVIVVCAASNHGNKFLQTIDFPARLGHVLSIGSHGPNGKATSFSPVGQQIDFLAPGEGIAAPCSIPYHHYITTESGTSYAAPAVVGLICLLLDYINKNQKYQRLIPLFKHHWVMKELLREMSASPGRPTNDEGFGPLNPMSFFLQPESFVERILLYIDPQSLHYT